MIKYVDGANLQQALNDVYNELDGKSAADHSHDTASKDAVGFMSAADKAFLDKLSGIHEAYAEYTFTSTQDYVTLGYCSGSCRNGLVVLSGWFTVPDGTYESNPIIIKGSFPSANTQLICGSIVNVTAPYINARLVLSHGTDGSSQLAHGGALQGGTYFFMAVYSAAACRYNLPYSL